MDNNELVLTRENFGDKLYNYLFAAVKMLLMARYELEIVEEEEGVIVIRYGWSRFLEYGNATLAWITPEAREVFRMLNEEGVFDNGEIKLEAVDESEPAPEAVNEYPEGFEPDRNEVENFEVRNDE